MRYSQYKYNFYLNASHSIYLDGKLGNRHPHTWEISIYAINKNEVFMMFTEVEKRIEEFLGKFQEKYINDYEPFTTLNPTLENIAHFFLSELQKILDTMNWVIFTIEISETPTRSYIISTLDNPIEEEAERKNIAMRILEESRKHKSQ